MRLAIHEIEYRDTAALSSEIEFAVACDRVEGKDLINIRLKNLNMLSRFNSAAAKLLRAMKREGVIQLFIFENEISDTEKMETVYLLNKFPELADMEKYGEGSVIIKL
ncbi:MAG: hypothetical protein E7617_03540 [Ruminococcaceae bacterium]|nr:hypothetical protein [Oscillospiraceae bacterium]